jgi:hypothetical protein
MPLRSFAIGIYAVFAAVNLLTYLCRRSIVAKRIQRGSIKKEQEESDVKRYDNSLYWGLFAIIPLLYELIHK